MNLESLFKGALWWAWGPREAAKDPGLMIRGRSEVWGSECASNPLTGKSASSRLRFRFVSCVRAGEAKLRGRERDVILNAGPPGS